LGVPCTLSSGYEDHISLTDIGIAILQEEQLVHAIFLKGRKFDEQVDRTSQIPLKYQILLSSNLEVGQVSGCLPVSEENGSPYLHPRVSTEDLSVLCL
jgi:hypothetical protein